MTTTQTPTLAADLRAAADFLDANPGLAPDSIGTNEYGATFYFGADEPAAEALWHALANEDHRWDYRYEHGDYSRIMGGRITDRLSVSVAVARS